MSDSPYNFGTPKDIEGSTPPHYSGRGHRTGVQFGYYVFLIIFLLSFFSSIFIIIILACTKHDFGLKPPGEKVAEEVYAAIFGQFGPTSSALILLGTPLLTLAALVGYCHIFNYKPY